MSTPPFFSPGVGYALVVGLGAAFAIGMSLLSWGLSRYMAEVQTSEMYMTAKHSVKTGLVATAVVSSWTIAATLLSSTTGEFLLLLFFLLFFFFWWWRGDVEVIEGEERGGEGMEPGRVSGEGGSLDGVVG